MDKLQLLKRAAGLAAAFAAAWMLVTYVGLIHENMAKGAKFNVSAGAARGG